MIFYNRIEYQIVPKVIKVREVLAKRYNVRQRGPHFNYRGLCEEAAQMFKDMMDREANNRKYRKKEDRSKNYKVSLIYGELKHSYKLETKYWEIRHVWALVEYEDGLKVYVDPTIGQFKDEFFTAMIPYPPNFYVDTKPPMWLCPDDKNPAKKFKHKRFFHFLIYEIWASLATILYTIGRFLKNNKYTIIDVIKEIDVFFLLFIIMLVLAIALISGLEALIR